uniref:Cystatin domain-containing protein n=1 Tax=Steinernema glaseri TaxID=37863 RepID=A0A1I7ZIF4_9BILA
MFRLLLTTVLLGATLGSVCKVFFSKVEFIGDAFLYSDFAVRFKIVKIESPEEQTHRLVLVYRIKAVKVFKDKYDFFTKGKVITAVVFNSPKLALDSEYIVSGWKEGYYPKKCQVLSSPSLWAPVNGTC